MDCWLAHIFCVTTATITIYFYNDNICFLEKLWFSRDNQSLNLGTLQWVSVIAIILCCFGEN